MAFLFILSLSCQGNVVVLFEEDFESPTLPKGRNYNFEAQSSSATLSISTVRSANYNNSAGSIRAQYPAPVGSGGYYVWGGFTPDQRDLRELYVEFKAKMPGHKHGLKFLKIFGQTGTGVGYANVTFGLDYTGVNHGGMYCISFGDGTSLANDTQNILHFSGKNMDWIGRSFGNAKVWTPQKEMWAASNWGVDWHHFRFYVKFNSGTSSSNEVADGEFYVEIDGRVYVYATGLLNRNPSNRPIDRVEFFGWSQTGNTPFEIWYDEIIVSTGGFTSGPKLARPLPPGVN